MPRANESDSVGKIQRVVLMVRKNPEATILAAGVVLVLAALVTQIGPFEIKGRASVTVTLITGAVFTIGGIIWLITAQRAEARRREAERARRQQILKGRDVPPVFLDPEFLLKVFLEAMPPAFIKGRSGRSKKWHLLESNALVDVQRSPYTREVEISPRRAQVLADHKWGDEAALDDGRSRQLEVSDTMAGERERTILTTKTCIRHDDRDFVVGWYVPVELRNAPDEDEIRVKDEAHQLLYRPLLARGDRGIKVRVGAALREEPAQSIDSEDEAPADTPVATEGQVE